MILDELIRHQGKTIKIYLAREKVVDPYENEVEVELMQPIGIKGIVVDLIFSQIQWKISGVNASKAKEIIVPKKYRNLLKNSYKIEVDGEKYDGWRVNGKMQLREEGDYVRLYVYKE